MPTRRITRPKGKESPLQKIRRQRADDGLYISRLVAHIGILSDRLAEVPRATLPDKSSELASALTEERAVVQDLVAANNELLAERTSLRQQLTALQRQLATHGISTAQPPTPVNAPTQGPVDLRMLVPLDPRVPVDVSTEQDGIDYAIRQPRGGYAGLLVVLRATRYRKNQDGTQGPVDTRATCPAAEEPERVPAARAKHWRALIVYGEAMLADAVLDYLQLDPYGPPIE